MKQYVRRAGSQAQGGKGTPGRNAKANGRKAGHSVADVHQVGKRSGDAPRVRPKGPAGDAGKDEVKPGKLITIRTVIGQEAPDVEHLPGELVITMSPEHYSMFRGRAKKAGKSMVAYFKEDMLGLPAKPAEADAPVPFEIVEEAPAAPVMPSLSEQFLMASLVATYSPHRRKSMLKRAQAAAKTVGMPFTDLLQAFVFQGIREIEETGELRYRPYLPDIVFTKLHARLAEIDRVFEFPLEDGFTQWIMSQAMEDLLKGEDGILFESYTFDNPKQAHRDYVAMVGRWRKEDGLPPLKLPPWRAQRVQKTERRAA